jgi:transcriptional regulator with XRE-family HTH domain
MHEGIIINYLRRQKNISQKKLAHEICTIRHLRNIEKGYSSPTYDIICKISQRLGGDIHLLINNDIQKYGLELFERIREIENLLIQWDYQSLEKKVDSLLHDNMIHLSSSILKKLRYYKGVCIYENSKDYNSAKYIFLDALGCNSIEDVIKHLASTFCDELDINICNAIAVNEAYSGNKDIAFEIFKSIQSNILLHNLLDNENRVKLQYNLVRLSYDLELYEETIKYALSNILLCKDRYIVKSLAGTYMYLANAEKKLGNHSYYKVYYKKFMYLSFLFDDNMRMKSAIDKVMNENEIDFDYDIEKGEV